METEKPSWEKLDKESLLKGRIGVLRGLTEAQALCRVGTPRNSCGAVFDTQ